VTGFILRFTATVSREIAFIKKNKGADLHRLTPSATIKTT
jgi:hypothetical protein